MSNVLQFPSASVNESPAPSDEAARIAALDTRSSCIVEAPAGSGKTGLLMQRYLKLLADPAVTQPEEVLAITFTNKATAELRERVINQLQAAAQEPQLGPTLSPFDRQTREFAVGALAHDRQLGWDLLSRPQRLNIRTIDSICASIANSLPILSGAGGSLRPTEDAKPLHRLAAERALMQLGGKDQALDHALSVVLLRRDASLEEVTYLIADMLAGREQWGQLIPFDPEQLTDEYLEQHTRPELERTLETIVCSGLTRAMNALPEGALEELTKMAREIGLNDGYKDAPNPIAPCTALEGPPEAIAAHLEYWKALIALVLTKDGGWRNSLNRNHVYFEASDRQKVRLKEIIEALRHDPLSEVLHSVRELPPARYPDDQWAVLKALFHVLRRALVELKLVFAEHGTCDFAELSIAARQALLLAEEGDEPVDLALTPGGALRHLLVDEMQDTSAAQYDLILRLTHSWDGATQTLFLVGDPKQSIYLFRQARVERFLRTMREGRLGSIRLNPLNLTANFRSQEGLVNACNHAFEQLFPSIEEVRATGDPSGVPYIPATAQKPDHNTRNIEWHPSISKDTTSGVATSLRARSELQQARDIRSVITEWLTRAPGEDRNTQRPLSIAVLARTRSHLGPIVSELKQAGIPFRAVDIDPLTTRQEVLDALALTRALLHPADRTAWLSVLRAPWCGLSLADLLTLAGEGLSADKRAPLVELVAARRASLSAEGQVLLDRVWPVLTASANSIGTEPIASHVERTWRSLGGDSFLNTEERTNVLRFFDVLREVAAQDSFVDLNVLSDRIEKLYAEPNPDPAARHVELVTIHKAKGLEWDVVIVPSLERQTGNTGSGLLNWLELDESSESASVLLAPIEGKGSTESDLLCAWLRNVQKARENAEQIRLFYVLSTRAREELHLFAAAERKDGMILPPSRSSLLKAVWSVAVPAFEKLQQSLLDREASSAPSTDAEPMELDLAASASEVIPVIQRFPNDFNPATRFLAAATKKLSYTPASMLKQGPIFERPEGSFAVRAFGNVAHRYLQIVTQRLEHTSVEALLAEITGWQPRLLASLRGEGLPPALAEREAARALRAIEQSINDPEGRWILSPQTDAFTERPLTLATANTLRVDRTFTAGTAPLSAGQSHTWIVDFKTGTTRGLSDQAFESEERSKYGPQLAAYAEAARALSPQGDAVMLGLYYPLIPRLLFWPG